MTPQHIPRPAARAIVAQWCRNEADEAISPDLRARVDNTIRVGGQLVTIDREALTPEHWRRWLRAAIQGGDADVIRQVADQVRAGGMRIEVVDHRPLPGAIAGPRPRKGGAKAPITLSVVIRRATSPAFAVGFDQAHLEFHLAPEVYQENLDGLRQLLGL